MNISNGEVLLCILETEYHVCIGYEEASSLQRWHETVHFDQASFDH